MEGDCAGVAGPHRDDPLRDGRRRRAWRPASSPPPASPTPPRRRCIPTPPMRDWESDKELGDDAAKGCKDIADQLVNWPPATASRSRSAAAAPTSCPRPTADPEDEGKTGRRTDGRDLTAEWTKKDNNHVFVSNKAGFDKIDVASGAEGARPVRDEPHGIRGRPREGQGAGEPSLAEMTAKAHRPPAAGRRRLRPDGRRRPHRPCPPRRQRLARARSTRSPSTRRSRRRSR